MPLVPGRVDNINIEANVNPCAHICRYCSVGDRGGRIPLRRLLAFIERFAEWRKGRDLTVQPGFLPAYDLDLPDLVEFWSWERRVMKAVSDWLPMGGLRLRNAKEMRVWLEERQAIGLQGINVAFAGIGATHDRWNGRRGDYDFLLSALQVAGELSLAKCTSIFLTRSSLPEMAALAARLKQLPGESEGPYARPFFYIGHAGHYDDYRITEEDRVAIPDFAREALVSNEMRSEREWIAAFTLEPEGAPEDLYLRLVLTPENIDGLESRSCDEIFAEMSANARETLSKLPSYAELSRSIGLQANTRLYGPVDIRRLWADRYLAANPFPFDRSLMHYHLGGRSQRPPRLVP